MSGNLSAIRILLGLCQVASEKDALLGASQSSDPKKHDDLNTLTDKELMRIATGGLKDKE